jgi:hypothetical protein
LNKLKSFQSQIYTVNEATFENIALSVFQYQAKENPVYKSYLQMRRIDPVCVHSINKVPFLPIDFFKNQDVKTGSWKEDTHFVSSGTTGSKTSTHRLPDADFYRQNTRLCFEHFFGPVSNYHFLALLPSYLEQSNSSLVAMMEYFIRCSGSLGSGFYLNNLSKLVYDIEELRKKSPKKIVVFGVAFALLDLAEKHSPDLSNCLVFETGGMKGRRKEITREELHEKLKKGFNVDQIYSEYGMTELFSQAYSGVNMNFKCPPWMRVLARDSNDPFLVGMVNKPGGLNVIDLANLHAIAFIETGDMGRVWLDGSFEVLGRLDNSDIRGCNLLAE